MDDNIIKEFRDILFAFQQKVDTMEAIKLISHEPLPRKLNKLLDELGLLINSWGLFGEYNLNEDDWDETLITEDNSLEINVKFKYKQVWAERANKQRQELKKIYNALRKLAQDEE